jgi:hypothetical protein
MPCLCPCFSGCDVWRTGDPSPSGLGARRGQYSSDEVSESRPAMSVSTDAVILTIHAFLTSKKMQKTIFGNSS